MSPAPGALTPSTSSRDENVTIGRQAWASSPSAQLLGAGTSNSATHSDVGLSGNPAAMRHGLKTDPPTKQQGTPSAQSIQAAGAPAGAITEPPATTTLKLASPQGSAPAVRSTTTTTTATTATPAVTTVTARPPATVAVTHAPATTVSRMAVPSAAAQHSRMERSVSTAIEQQRQRMAPVVRQKQREEAQQQAEQQQQQAASGSSGTSSGTPVGQPIIVATSQTQTSWLNTALQHIKALVLGTPPDMLSLGPPWTKWPDFARTNNINALVAGLWPSLTEAVTQQLVLQMVPQLMTDMAKQYGAGVLTGLELLEFDLGQIPPRLDGIKVYQGDQVGDEQVLMELAAAWGSNIKITVGVTLQLLGHTLKLPITLQKLQLQSRLRLVAQSLLDHYPYAGSVGVSLMEPPHLEFELPVAALGGLDLLALPGVRGLFRVGLRLASRQLAVYPKGIAVPLVEGGAAASGPQGMLEVRLVRVSGLRSEDLIGHSDPYVILRLREGRMLRSRTINNNNNPEFDQTFKMLVDDTQTQVLQLIVMDEDMVGGGTVMGVAQMPLKQSAAVNMPRTKVPLTLRLHKLMNPERGIGGVLQLPVRVAGLPLTAAASGGRFLYQNLAGALGVGSGGRGNVTGVNHLSKVLDETGWLGPSEEFLDEHGLTAWKDGDQQQQQQQRQQQQHQQGQGQRQPLGQGPGTSSITNSSTVVPSVMAVKPLGTLSAAGSSSSFASFHSAMSQTSSAAASGASSRTASVSGSPMRGTGDAAATPAAATPAGGPVVTTAASPTTAAVAAATAAAAAVAPAGVVGGAGASQTAHTGGSGFVSGFANSSGSSAGSTGGSSGSSGSSGGSAALGGPSSQGVARGLGLSRLDSRSAPLLHVYEQPGTASSSSGGSTTGVGGSSSGSTNRAVVKVTKLLNRISKKGDSTGDETSNASAPPTEVVEHQKQVQQQEEAAGRQDIQQMQTDVTPGESGRGISGDQLKKIYRGTVFLELTYTSFLKPAGTPMGAGASPAGTAAGMSAANNAAIMPHDKGVLAVTLVCAHHLGGWQGEADPYVTLSLMDSAGAVHPGGGAAGGTREQTMRSTTIYNEDSPRWNEKFDFIGVRADSILLATVWDQATVVDAVTSLKLTRERFKDHVLGRVKVSVMDVANAGRIRRRWPMQGAMMGELELVVQWIPTQELGA